MTSSTKESNVVLCGNLLRSYMLYYTVMHAEKSKKYKKLKMCRASYTIQLLRVKDL